MNTKRQTIWLVSMLSLMVVLSAYYLFTEDVNKLNPVTEKVAQEDIKVTTEEKDLPEGEQAVNGTEVTDAQVLEQIAKVKTGTDYFVELAYKRNQDVGKQIEKLQNIMGDTNKTTEEIAEANDDFDKLQTMQAKVESLEELLGQTYGNVIVMEEQDDKYKAVVQVSEKLEARQAQGIIDLMIQELGVSKDSVSVQYLQ